MANPSLLWRRVLEATIDTLRGKSRGQYHIGLPRLEGIEEFFEGVPRDGSGKLGGYTLQVPLEAAEVPIKVPATEFSVAYIGPKSARGDWRIRSQRPETAYPLWREGVGLTPETQPGEDFVVLVRDPRGRFHARWLRQAELARLPKQLAKHLGAGDAGIELLGPTEWREVAQLFSILAGAPSEPTASRKSAWLRDELILALDLYRREGRNPPKAAVAELSDLLRSMPIEQQLSDDPQFRNPASVRLKLANFVALDPGQENQGMSRGGRLDQRVMDEFGGDAGRLAKVAAAIKGNLGEIGPLEIEKQDDEFADAPEGRILTRIHRVRERNRAIVKRRKAEALSANGVLACEACGFDFGAAYGERGEGFIECHHTVPVRDLMPGHRTALSDLALLCANCHRMIHRRAHWLTIEDLRAEIEKAKA